jgi:type III restriction enzyme
MPWRSLRTTTLRARAPLLVSRISAGAGAGCPALPDDPGRCHVNRVVLDSDWEAELCRVAESHPRVRAWVKNHNLGLEVPYRYGSEMRIYRPDFIVRVDDGHGDEDLLNLVVEIEGYRRD